MIQSRLDRLRALMAERGLEQYILTSPQSIYYLTGEWVAPLDRLDALVVTPVHCRMMCYVLAVIEPEGCETTIYSDAVAAVTVLSSLLSAAPTGLDGALEGRFLLPLMEARPDIRFCGGDCVERARMIKDQDEIQRLRRASQVTDRAFGRALAQLEEGMTELDLGHAFSVAFDAEGVNRFHGDPMVCFGAGAAEPHHAPGNARLATGDAVMVDTGKRIDGYYSDMTRTIFFRRVTNLQRRVYDIVLQANLAAIEAARPGALIGDIDRAARDVIQSAGYGDAFMHRTSHGIGIDYHEEPFDHASRPLMVEPGMCFSIEPGIYLPGQFGVRIEDLVVMTEDGSEIITAYPKSLSVVG